MPAPPGQRVLGGVLLFLLLVFGLSPPAVSQQITYEYDALGRLILVSSPEGIARYEYDAVGNIVRIESRRLGETTDPVAILMLSPNRGAVGTVVTLYGKGFGETPAANQVAFNGTPAAVSSAGTSRLVVSVPSGAATGPVTVTAPAGSATSLEPFTVTAQLTLVPAEADVVLGGAVGFTARLGGVPTSDVTWRVNGIVGGNATLGTIGTTGTYTAPSSVPSIQPVPVEAVLTADPTQVATAPVRVSGQPSGLGASAPVSVQVAPSGGNPVVTGALSVTGAAATMTPLVSGPISVTGAAGSTLAASGLLSLTGGPVVLSVSPATAPQGATGLGLTLTGANLQGASAVAALLNGLTDTTITIGAVTPAGDGQSLTATLTIGSGSAVGLRVLSVVTPQGTSTGINLGTNTLTVTAP